jgi:spore coat polysaccharide biosynthesis protein SpsF (cytidylyltransferase family)
LCSPWLYENERDLTKLSNKVSSSVALINKSLREIGKIVGIDKIIKRIKKSDEFNRLILTCKKELSYIRSPCIALA